MQSKDLRERRGSVKNPVGKMSVSNLFLILKKSTWPDSFLASHPKSVRDAIENYRKQLDESPVEAHDRLGNDKEVLNQAALYMHTKPELIAQTDSTTMGLGLMYGGFRFKSGDHVISSIHDHYATQESLRLNAGRQGAQVQTIKLYDDGKDADIGQIVSEIAKGIRPETRLVALTWVHSSTGVKLPIKEISEVIAKANMQRSTPILFFVDGVHGFGIEDIFVEDLGCDAFMAGCHKWLFGPRGTGIIWANDRGWDAVEPTIPTFNWQLFNLWLKGEPMPKARKAAQMSPGGFHSFEHRWALDEAFKFHLVLGKKRVEARIHSLNGLLKESLKKVGGVTLHTPDEARLSAGIVTFEVAGKSPHQVVEELGKRKIIASTTPYAKSFARLTPGILNSERDVEAAVNAVASIATA